MLAVSVPQTTIIADPRRDQRPVAYAAKLAPIVQVDQAALEDRLVEPQRARSPTSPARSTTQAAEDVRKLDLVGISYQDESRRFYPTDRLAGPGASASSAPTTTVSAAWSTTSTTLLTGKPGSVQVERDPQGNDIPGGERQVTPAKRGQDLVLTIDSSLQWNTEQALAAGRRRR